jgi:hypothetical protein
VGLSCKTGRRESGEENCGSMHFRGSLRGIEGIKTPENSKSYRRGR